ncbi:hypothetical protein SPLA10_PHROGS00079 [Salmonella phage SPLA10]|nr:hypothetical protein SPLA10_PHROGS00079 [Salmonella phage SPLA10]
MEEDEELTLPDAPDDGKAKLDEQDPDLSFTQQLRKRVIEKLMVENGGDVPTDKDSASIFANFLDGIDRQSIAKQRIQISKKDSKSNAQIALLLEEMSRKRNTGERVEIDITPSSEALSRNEILEGSWLPAPTVVSGELITENAQETPDQFFKRVEAENPDLLTGGLREDDD